MRQSGSWRDGDLNEVADEAIKKAEGSGSGRRKITVCVLMCLFCLTACTTVVTQDESETQNEDPLYYCECCGEEVTQVVNMAGDSGYYCYACVVDNGYNKCHECGGYYEDDGWGCNEVYCHSCFERKGKACFLCWQSMENMVTIRIDGEDYYICTDCVTDYFENIEPMKPVDYCGDCGKVFLMGDQNYEHYVFAGAMICPKCLVEKGYEKCLQCGKYTDDGLVDGRCGRCREKGSD